MKGNTKQHILDEAQSLVQRRGYNAFSFRRLAEAVGVKSSSVHYHFPTKGDLGAALMRRLRGAFGEAFADIEKSNVDSEAKLRRYVQLFAGPLVEGEKACMGAMLAASAEAVPEDVQKEVRGFAEDHERFLADLFDQGREAGDFVFQGSSEARAEAVFAALEGASILAHALGDPERLRRTTEAQVVSLSHSA